MNKFTCATFIKLLKKYVNNPKMTDPFLVNECFSCIVENKRVTNKNNDLFEFSNSRTSELLHNEISIPIAILNELEDPDLLNIIRNDFYNFIQMYFNEAILSKVSSEVLILIKNDSSFPKEIINSIEDKIENPKEFLLLIFIESLKIENKIEFEDKSIVWERGNSSIKVIWGDIFKFGFTKRKKNKNIVVIPVDTSFSLDISNNLEKERNPLVSEETLHGMWIRRCQNSDISLKSIRTRINEFLEINKVDCRIERGRRIYPIGTIVTLEINNGVFFLIACSEFDEFNRARSSKEDIENALTVLIKYYDLRGQGYKLYVPLIGTGRSRANLSYKESYDLIVKTFKENEKYIQGEILIVVLPEVYKKMGGSNGL